MTGFAVFHNHLIVDAVAAVFPFGTEPFVRLREELWLRVMREASQAGRSIIFTFAPEPTVTTGFPDRIRAVVEEAGGEAIFVRLAVSVAEQERRLTKPSRAEFGKLTSVEILRELRDQYAACELAMPVPALTIDTEISKPVEAARHIADLVDE